MQYLIFLFLVFSNILIAQKKQLGVVLEDSIVLKKEPRSKSINICNVTKNQIVTILEQSKTKDFYNKKAPCEEYPWIKVAYQNKIGWILGKFVFRIIENDKKLLQNTIVINTKAYQLITARNFAYGFIEYDEKGAYVDTHGCPEFYAVGLYDKIENEVIFFPMPNEIEHTNDYIKTKIWGVFSDNGMREKVIKINVKDFNTLQIKVISALQEDCVSYELEAIIGNKSLKVIDYQRFIGENCH